MTAAGLALIAGGLATLVGFRHLLWGGGGGRRRTRPQRAIEPARRMALGATPHVPRDGDAAALHDPARSQRTRGRAADAADPHRAGRAAADPHRAGRAAADPHRTRRVAGDQPEMQRAVRGADDEPEQPGVGHEAAGEANPLRAGRGETAPRRLRRAGRRRAAAGVAAGPAGEPRPGSRFGDIEPPLPDAPGHGDADGDREVVEPVRRHRGGLARIGLADDEPADDELLHDELVGDELVHGELVHGEPSGDDPSGDDPSGDDPSGDVRSPGAPGAHEEAGTDGAAEDGDGVAAPEPADEETPAVTASADGHPVNPELTVDAPADEEPAGEPDEPVKPEPADVQPVAQDNAHVRAPATRSRIDRHGDRVDGWVRPRHQDDDIDLSISGEYWTPVPRPAYDDAGYGWPVPVERLPAVPPYPPLSGFDVEPGVGQAEPTAVVPQWPPAQPSGRIELPRSWASRDRDEDGDEPSPPRQAASGRRPSRSERRRSADSTELLPSVDDQADPVANAPRQDRRPRPRPRPSQPERSTVYRSRHAADPS